MFYLIFYSHMITSMDSSEKMSASARNRYTSVCDRQVRDRLEEAVPQRSFDPRSTTRSSTTDTILVLATKVPFDNTFTTIQILHKVLHKYHQRLEAPTPAILSQPHRSRSCTVSNSQLRDIQTARDQDHESFFEPSLVPNVSQLDASLPA